MRDFLTKNKLEVENTLFRLKELDLINDTKFAREFVNRSKGKKLLKTELKRKGIADEIINNQLSTVDEVELAEKFLNKKKNLRDSEQVKRLLYSRGFSWDTIEKTVRKRYN
jgi:SOS response regulatory protein OraA/RecX